ncbi:cysteine--tRNA ligase [Candidatus Gottesmanbacteria bacterium]|nr:cysteine--tRNA ligase [Candidatus Gottesmanbacteria bacterium]
MLQLYNTFTKKVEAFTPMSPPNVGMYTCGMTVYDYAHIGHGRKYTGDDILRRVLTRLGYTVTHVQNVTDVGHLVSDADEGEDKLEKGAAKAGKTVWEVANFFTKHFYDSMDKLNILRPSIICKATDHIPEQTALIKKLVEKGYAYDTPEAVYFDVTKFADYGTLFGQSLSEKKTAVREGVRTGQHKRHPADFTLWFKRVGRFVSHTMHWDSPWGDGFPGWHIECSAMAMRYLGETFDIHTGGIDHIPVHHPNEIAQSEAATGKPFVRFWVHHAFLKVDARKMSKSLGNFHTIEDVEKRGFDPLSLRYFYMTAHYRKPLNFTWEALEGTQNSLKELRLFVSRITSDVSRTILTQEKLKKIDDVRKRFDEAITDDLNMPQALAVTWELVKSNIPSPDKYDLLMDFDEVLGLDLRFMNYEVRIPEEITNLAQKREMLRQQKKFDQADEIRKQIEEKGYLVEDASTGSIVKKKIS